MVNYCELLVQVRTEYGVLPEGHPTRTDAQLDMGVGMLERGDPTTCAEQILKPMMEQTEQVGQFFVRMFQTEICFLSLCKGLGQGVKVGPNRCLLGFLAGFC